MSFKLLSKAYTDIKDILTPCEWTTQNKNKEHVEIATIPCSFDIEVSSFYRKNSKGEQEKLACMYLYGIGINGKVKVGRSWRDFLEDINQIVNYYNLSRTRRLIIYVHNFQYEFQFIRKFFKWDQVFSVDMRRPVYARTVFGIEFRCSYILSNLSLAKVGENLHRYKVKKLVGDLDYNLVRHTKTPINEKEMGYMVNDCLVVMAYIQELIEQYGKITKLPLTATGFTRMFCKERCIIGDDKWEYRQLIRKLTLTPYTYKLLKKAYAGGFTHADPFYVGMTVGETASFDFTSSYPTTMVSEKFPMSKPYKIELKSERMFNEALKRFNCLMDVTFVDIDDNFLWEHYISASKCIELEDEEIDNGRVVSASKLRICLTELDYDVIKRVYKWKVMHINEFYIFEKDYLPKPLVMCVLELYKNKTELKGIEGKEEEYHKAKALINSVYGMCVTDIAKDESLYEDGNIWVSEKQDLTKVISKYNKSWSRFLYYPWGIWITAYARHNLWSAILTIKSDYIYSDTDSVKIKNKEKYKEYFDNYNKEIVNKLLTVAKHYNIDESYIKPKNKKGEEKVLGIWDYEGTYKHFKTLGAKRYLVEEQDGSLMLTVSGVNKTKGAKFLKDKFKTNEAVFDNFKEDLEFDGEATGKMIHTYIDYEIYGEIIDYLGNKSYFNELSCIHLEPCNYRMSLASVFKRYLEGIKDSSVINNETTKW